MWDVWQKNGPPVYMAVAGYLGLMDNTVKPGAKNNKVESGFGDLEQLAKMAGPGGVFN